MDQLLVIGVNYKKELSSQLLKTAILITIYKAFLSSVFRLIFSVVRTGFLLGISIDGLIGALQKIRKKVLKVCGGSIQNGGIRTFLNLIKFFFFLFQVWYKCTKIYISNCLKRLSLNISTPKCFSSFVKNIYWEILEQFDT